MKYLRLLGIVLFGLTVYCSDAPVVGQQEDSATESKPKTKQNETEQSESPEKTEAEESREPSAKRLGIVKEKPSKGPFVKVADGYMIPYKTMIPGTDVKFEMIPVPGGSFVMGSPESEGAREDDEGPQIKIVVEPFWIGKHEVTWAEYKQFMRLDNIFKTFKRKKIRKVDSFDQVDAVTAPSSLYEPTFTFEAGQGPNQPAATMTQFAAKQYTKWLSLMSDDFYRLPYESEWEYACRAGTTTAYYFGNDPEDLEKHAWFSDNSDEERHEVGKLKPNPWGIYDMYGNVAEWVLDKYSEDGYEQVAKKLNGKKSLTSKEAFAKPDEPWPLVLRGGSFELDAEQCRSASRLASDDEEWKDSDPNYPQCPWWYTDTPALGAGMRLVRPFQVPTSANEKLEFWNAGLEDIVDDAKDRIEENGKGSLGKVDPKLPEAIKAITDR